MGGACFGSSTDLLVQYVPSRSFYCVAYEQAVAALPEFLFLKHLVQAGFNVLLLGPDGHPIDTDQGAVGTAYFDPNFQFGHGRVILALLREERPWASQPCCWRA